MAKKPTEHKELDPFRDPENFLEKFAKVASHFKWSLREGRKVRTRIEGVDCCPLQAYGFVRSSADPAARTVPDTRDLCASCGVHDSVASHVVHHADDIVTSRYYNPDFRRRLMAACKLKEPSAVTED